MRESNILKKIRLALTTLGGVVTFRNNVGTATAPDGSVIRFGLTVGSSDLIGWRVTEITPEMVGSRVAVFTAIEVKTERGKITPAQLQFLTAVEKSGGVAVLARSETDAIQGVREWKPMR